MIIRDPLEFPYLDPVMDADALHYLEGGDEEDALEIRRAYVAAIRQEVNAGRTPLEIKKHVKDRNEGGRAPFAATLAMAAAEIARNRGKV